MPEASGKRGELPLAKTAMENELNNELKMQFAGELLRSNGDPFKAAFAVFPFDTGKALQIARLWYNDPGVLAEKDRLLLSKDAKSFLPTKDRQATDVYAIATDPLRDGEIRLKAHRLFAEIMGYIEKPTQGGGVNILNQGVMVVRDAGSDADWETKAAEHQRKLTGDAIIN